MQDNTLFLLLAAFGLGVGCLTLIGLVLLLASRLARGPLYTFLSMMARSDDDEDESIPVTRTPAPNLRAIAEQHDFDTAVAAQTLRPDELGGSPSPLHSPRQSPLGTQQHPRLDIRDAQNDLRADDLPPSLRRHANRRGSVRDRREYEDEVGGGILGDDGDDSEL